MQHQDWNTVTFNNNSETKRHEEQKKIHSNKTTNPDDYIFEAPTTLGKTISRARAAKNMNQKQLAGVLGISTQILARWETNKEIPNNAQIAKVEKTLGTKLPRSKKVLIEN